MRTQKIKITTAQEFRELVREIDSASSAMRIISFLYKTKPSYTFNVRNELQALERKIAPYLNQLKVSEIEEVLRVMSWYNYRHLSHRFMQNFESAIVFHIQNAETVRTSQLTPRHLSAFMNLFAKMLTRPSDSFMQVWETQALQVLPSFNPQNLANSIQGMASIGIKPSETFLRAWLAESSAKILEFNDQNLANSVYSLNLVKAWETLDAFVNLTSASRWLQIHEKGSEIHRKQLSLTQMYLEIVLESPHPSLRIFRNDFAQLVSKPREGSWLEFEVQMYLVSKKLKYVEEYQTEHGFYVDIFIPSQNRIMQIDGPSHFIRVYPKDKEAQMEQRPQDLHINDVLRSSGYTVERLNQDQIRDL